MALLERVLRAHLAAVALALEPAGLAGRARHRIGVDMVDVVSGEQPPRVGDGMLDEGLKDVFRIAALAELQLGIEPDETSGVAGVIRSGRTDARIPGRDAGGAVV